MNITEAIDKLKAEHPDYVIDGGDGVSGLWAMAYKDDGENAWKFSRGAVTNADTLYHSISAAITSHLLNG